MTHFCPFLVKIGVLMFFPGAHVSPCSCYFPCPIFSMSRGQFWAKIRNNQRKIRRYPPVYQGPKKRQNFGFLGRISIQGPRSNSVSCLHSPKNAHKHPGKSYKFINVWKTFKRALRTNTPRAGFRSKTALRWRKRLDKRIKVWKLMVELYCITSFFKIFTLSCL